MFKIKCSREKFIEATEGKYPFLAIHDFAQEYFQNGLTLEKNIADFKEWLKDWQE